MDESENPLSIFLTIQLVRLSNKIFQIIQVGNLLRVVMYDISNGVFQFRSNPQLNSYFYSHFGIYFYEKHVYSSENTVAD